MRKTNTCPKCGSKEIAADIVVPDHYEYGRKVPQQIAVAKTPQNLIFRGIEEFQIRAWICTDCGFIEQYLRTPKAFARAYREGESNKT